MVGYTLFHMDPGYREYLIEKHHFFVNESRARLLTQFDDVSAEADAFAERWATEHSHLFDPESDDPDDLEERAWEESIGFYGMLDDLHAEVRLAIIAGMFHGWDKDLRDWIVTQIRHWHSGKGVPAEIWKASFPRLMEFLSCFGWDVDVLPCHRGLDRCRLVVNVYKHGEGQALESLKDHHSDLIAADLLNATSNRSLAQRILGYRQLKVTDSHLDEFSNAIVDFWAAMPVTITEDSFRNWPSWLKKAVAQDKET